MSNTKVQVGVFKKQTTTKERGNTKKLLISNKNGSHKNQPRLFPSSASGSGSVSDRDRFLDIFYIYLGKCDKILQ